MPTYLDANGNPVPDSAPTYLDPNTGESMPKGHEPPGWSIMSVLSGTSPAHQAIDEASRTVPIDTSSVGGFAKSVGTDLGAGAVRLLSPLAHPLNAIGSTAKMMSAAMGNTGDQYDVASGLVRPFVENPGGEAVAAIPQAALMAAGAARAPTVASATEGADASGGLVGRIGSSANAIGSKYLPSIIDGTPESLITRAIKPGKNNANWLADAQQAIPLMKSVEQQLGRPIAGVDDALSAAAIAKKSIWQQYQQHLGPAAQTGATIDGNGIADAMVNSIDKRTAMQNPGLVQKVSQIADTYRRPVPLTEAEDFLQSANKDLNTYYSKNKVGQQVAMNDPDISSTVAEAEALRKSLYDKLDSISGPGAAQLKKAYGSLSNVEKELYGRQLVAARQQLESLSEQIGTVKGVGSIAKGVVTLPFRPLGAAGDIAEGTQNIAIARALKARNTSDAMITRAFQAAQPAQPFPMPNFRPPMTTNLLPAQSGAKTPMLAPDPGMSGGEQIAALMHYLRQNPQLALPAKASAIPLPPSF